MFNIFIRKPKQEGRVSILIPTRFDSRYIIELCIKSIKKRTDYSDYQIIVCDSGVDKQTSIYLEELTKENEIKLIKTKDPVRPKDDLIKAVDSKYYILMHDDIRIIKRDWLTRRVVLLNSNNKNAIVGTILKNNMSSENNNKRFFPLGLLVKTDISRKLELSWGKQPGFDTGAIAYNRFFSQSEYKFVPYKTSRDIYHFSEMTWTKRKLVNVENFPGLDIKLAQRGKKIKIIRELLRKGLY